MFVHVCPPLVVSWTTPSSLPVRIVPARAGDSATVVRVPKSPTPSSRESVVESRTMPMIGSSFHLPFRVRSALITSHDSPPSRVRKRRLPP